MDDDAGLKLSKLTPRALRELATKYKVKVPPKAKKDEVIDALLESRHLEKILGEESYWTRQEEELELPEESPKPPEEASQKSEEDVKGVEKEIPKVEPPVKRLEIPADPEADELLAKSKNIDVDFDDVEDLIENSRMRFEEADYERAMATADESFAMLEEKRREALQRIWAYGVASAQKLLEESGRSGKTAEQALSLLQSAKQSLKDGTFPNRFELLKELESVIRKPLSEELKRARETLYEKQDLVTEVAQLGADVRQAEDFLSRARDALRKDDPDSCFSFGRSAELAAESARKKRIAEIDETVPKVVSAVEEAAAVGAEVTDARRLLDKARKALAEKDYVMTAELLSRAERSALESQKNQIDKAMKLRNRQIEKLREAVTTLEPKIREAAAFGFPVQDVMAALNGAKQSVFHGDYVTGAAFVKQVEEGVKRLEAHVTTQKERLGMARPSGGVCGRCGSHNLEFSEEGDGKCLGCGRLFRWRQAPMAAGPPGVTQKLKDFFSE